MKILIVIQNFWPEESRINAVSKPLAKKMSAVEVLPGFFIASWILRKKRPDLPRVSEPDVFFG